MSKALTIDRITVWPDGSARVQLGSQAIDLPRLFERVAEEQGHELFGEERRVGVGGAQRDFPMLCLRGVDGAQHARDLGQKVAKLFAQRTLKRPFLALSIFALSLALLRHKAKPNRTWGAA